MSQNRIARSLRQLVLAASLAALAGACGSESPEELLAAARSQFDKRDYGAATIQLRNALKQNPQHAEARYLLGQTLMQSGDLATAEKELRKALEFGHPADQAAPPLLRVLLELGQVDKVLKEASGLRLSAPDANADLQASVGNAELAKGRLDAARTAYLSALTFVPGYPRAQLGEAKLKAYERDFAGAVAIVDQVLAKNAELAEALLLRADLAVVQNDNEVAARSLEQALKLRPWNIDAHYQLVSTLLRAGKTDDARNRLAAMKKLAPKHPLPHYLAGFIAFQDKQFDLARSEVLESLKLAPDFLPAVLLAGLVEGQLGSLIVAEEHLLKVLAKHPRNSVARQALVRIYLANNRPERAHELIEPLVAAHPEDKEVLALAARVYLVNGEADKSSELMQRAANLDPGDPKKRSALAVARFASGDAEQGFADLAAAASLSADDTGPDIAIIMGRIARKEYDLALEAIASLEAKQPKAALTHNLRGIVLVAKNDFAGARKSLERALELAPDYMPALTNLAQLDLRDKQPEAAKQRFQAVIDRQPNNARAELGLASLLAQTKAPPAEVLKRLQRAVSADAKSVAARQALVNFHLSMKDTKAALAAAREAASALPDDRRILESLGSVQLAAGAPNEAVQSFTKLVTAAPGDAGALVRLAGAQIAANSKEAALQSLRKALSINPKFLEAQVLIAGVEAATGNVTEAIKVAKNIQQQWPKLAAGHTLEGNVLKGAGKAEAAAAAYRAAFALEKSAQGLVLLHQALTDAGKTRDADKLAADWLGANPKDVTARAYLAERSLLARDYAGAARQFKRIVEIVPNDAAALNNLAWALGETKDPTAIEYAEKALSLQPDNAAILDTLGWLLFNRGDTQRALPMLGKAVAAAPNAPVIRLHLAKALVKSGDKAAARGELETLAKLGDKFSRQAEVAQLLGSL